VNIEVLLIRLEALEKKVAALEKEGTEKLSLLR